eukprot:4031417-Amphidinium_carterae.1
MSGPRVWACHWDTYVWVHHDTGSTNALRLQRKVLLQHQHPASAGSSFKAPAFVVPKFKNSKVRKVELSAYLAHLPVTVQASGERVEHNN